MRPIEHSRAPNCAIALKIGEEDWTRAYVRAWLRGCVPGCVCILVRARACDALRMGWSTMDE
eukprot:6209975-Pleurochrysis_carterae.AAC.2